MALSVTVDHHAVLGNKRAVFGTIAFDSSYPTGGEALAATDIGLRMIDWIAFMNGRLGYNYYTDTALPASSINVEILCPTGGAAPTSIADPSTAVPSGATAVTSTAAQPNLTETGGRGVELGNTTDASTLTSIEFMALGV